MNPFQHSPRRHASRRQWLARTGFGLGGLALASLFADDARAADPKARAKRVIHLFLEGGMSQMDLFDPKPKLTAQDGKEVPHPDDPKNLKPAFGSPFQFAKHGRSGLEVSELLPHLAKHADDLCVVRSMHTETPAHDSAMLVMNWRIHVVVTQALNVARGTSIAERWAAAVGLLGRDNGSKKSSAAQPGTAGRCSSLGRGPRLDRGLHAS